MSRIKLNTHLKKENYLNILFKHFSTRKNIKTLDKSTSDWDRIMCDAEKLVNYPKSCVTHRWLQSEKLSTAVILLRRGNINKNHPLNKTIKEIVFNKKKNLQPLGLIVLLFSKVVGCGTKISDPNLINQCSGILKTQCKLAEVLEIIRLWNIIHQGMFNLHRDAFDELEDRFIARKQDLIIGNNLAVLAGDFLLAVNVVDSASLRNNVVVGLIASSTRDIAESSFFGDRDQQNFPLPFKPSMKYQETESIEEFLQNDLLDNYSTIKFKNPIGNPEKEWTIRNILKYGRLLGKGLESTVILANQTDKARKQAYLFGRHLSFAWQAYLDLEPFLNYSILEIKTFDLVSAPVLFQLHYNPKLYNELKSGSYNVIKNGSYKKILSEVINGPGLQMTKNLLQKHCLIALKILDGFPKNDARIILKNIIHILQET